MGDLPHDDAASDEADRYAQNPYDDSLFVDDTDETFDTPHPSAPEPPVPDPAPPVQDDPLSEEEAVCLAISQVLARLEFRPNDDARALVQAMSLDKRVLHRMGHSLRTVVKGVFEVVLFDCDNTPGGVVRFAHLAQSTLLEEYDPRVAEQLATIAALIEDGPLDGTASARWEELRENIQRRRTLDLVGNLVRKIRAKSNREELMEAFHELEPPTVHRAEAQGRSILTARQVDSDQKALLAMRPPIRFSSGFATLDLALTGPHEPLGLLAPGEQVVFPGMTGTGKSSFSYSLVPSLAQDLVNWGLGDASLVFLHTEEAPATKVRNAGLGEGGRYHHLADRVIVDNVGSSRRRVVEVLYELVMEAQDRSDQTGRNITDFLPYVVVVDYIQAITGEVNEDPTRATFNTAELLLRGVQDWNPSEMEKFGGLAFRDYAGRPWPDGMETHKVAVVTFAQLNKQDDRLMLYRPGSREHSLEDFTFEDMRDTPVWRDESGSGWMWEVRPGDARVLRQNAINGSQRILQNADAIVFLHRSRPYNNPAHRDETGAHHLEDVRARLLPDKTRHGAALKAVPMHFDVDETGSFARYYDVAGEKALAEGRFEVADSWVRPGDPLLPKRPAPRPLSGIRY